MLDSRSEVVPGETVPGLPPRAFGSIILGFASQGRGSAGDPRGGQRGVNGLDLVGLDRAVHQIVDRIPAEGPAHAGHQEADDQRRDRIEQGIAGQVARDAQSHHQRGRRIRA